MACLRQPSTPKNQVETGRVQAGYYCTRVYPAGHSGGRYFGGRYPGIMKSGLCPKVNPTFCLAKFNSDRAESRAAAAWPSLALEHLPSMLALRLPLYSTGRGTGAQAASLLEQVRPARTSCNNKQRERETHSRIKCLQPQQHLHHEQYPKHSRKEAEPSRWRTHLKFA